jgi:hypothetical protein
VELPEALKGPTSPNGDPPSRIRVRERGFGMSMGGCLKSSNTLPLGLRGHYGDVFRLARVHVPLSFGLSERERILIRHSWDAKGNVPSFVLGFCGGVTQPDDN